MNIRKRSWEIANSANPDDSASLIFDIVILSLIILNAVAVMLETVRGLRESYAEFFWYFEIFSVFIFSFEYLIRLWSCVAHPIYSRPVRGRIRYALTPMAVIDLLAVLPFFIPLLGVDLRLVRLFRLIRIFRLVKAVRYLSSLKLFANVFRSRKEELAITSFLMVLLLIISSALMYFFENARQPEQFPDIPSAMWWAIATLTTVGYGDIYPVTGIGRFLASIIAIFGIALFALPAGILGSGFVDEIRKEKSEVVTCPNCGHRFSNEDV